MFENEYESIINALDRTAIITMLPHMGGTGIIGRDANEYPIPTQTQLNAVFEHNQELVDRKMSQGFTQLQLTPIAMPVSQLMDRLKAALVEYATQGKVIRTKKDPSEADLPVMVKLADPIWIWARVRQILDTPDLVYFPQNYTYTDHQGLIKSEVVHNTSICALPGWSVGLIESNPIMPQEGQGKVIGGRKQLEEYLIPREYLNSISKSPYQGETGWTLEDFLTYFLVQLETTNQVSDDRQDSNALWLLGSFVPELGGKYMRSLVAVGYWYGKRFYLSVHRSGNRLRDLVARTMVRLGA